MAYHERTIPLLGYTVSMQDAKRIFQRLSAFVAERGAQDVGAFVKPPDMTEEVFTQEKQHWLNNAYKVTVTIKGTDGSSLHESDESIFTSENLPANIATIFMTNTTAFEHTTRIKPANTFIFHLDFNKPPLLDTNNIVSAPTPNYSNLNIQGNNDSWLATISDKVMTVMSPKKNRRGFLHVAFVYDAGLMIAGIPLGIYLCWKSSEFVGATLGQVHTVLAAAAYIYVFMVALWAYRLMFGYAKWAFPIVEMEEDRSTSARHRFYWSAIVLGVVGNFAYDILKRL